MTWVLITQSHNPPKHSSGGASHLHPSVFIVCYRVTSACYAAQGPGRCHRSTAPVCLRLSLQGKVAQTACMSACKHLSTSMMQMLLDSELKQISMGAIQQFNLDVIQCERESLYLARDPPRAAWRAGPVTPGRGGGRRD